MTILTSVVLTAVGFAAGILAGRWVELEREQERSFNRLLMRWVESDHKVCDLQKELAIRKEPYYGKDRRKQNVQSARDSRKRLDSIAARNKDR